MELKNIRGIGPKLETYLNNINIFSVEDLITYYPYKYNFIQFKNITDLNNEIGYLKCEIVSEPKVFYIKKNFNKMTFLILVDNMTINVVIFNRAFLKQNLKVNKEVILFGKYDNLKNQFIASDIKFNLSNNSIEPVYHLTHGITSSTLTKIIKESFDKVSVEDYIPDYINDKYSFISIKDAINKIHFPKDINDIKVSKLKLIYRELFEFMFKINYLKIKNKQSNGIIRDINNKKSDEFLKLLPFKLTPDQEKAKEEIFSDMISEKRMNRLLLGDVGSGKTIIATYAIYLNYISGYQTAFMAPTEILANQHFITLTKLFKSLNMNIVLLTGSTKVKEKKEIYENIKQGKVDLLIGTHALLTDDVIFKNLGLVITDEQHRFGVLQRSNLENKGINPDVLYLSATPIPRTYALTIYGDTDISIIKTKPSGRKEIITKVYKEKDIKEVLTKMYDEMKKNHQIFVVSPLIENEERDLNSVIILKDKLKAAFKDANIEIIHGRMKQLEKDSIMERFKDGIINILISTTVIEVGIDIKNATMMVIYNAERFGLATLHQLRGRVGRNELQSYCFLISDKDNNRLKVMEESNDGFYITEKDFEQRKEGDLFGTKQSGDMIFKIADIKRDYQILLQAKKDSEEYIKDNIYLNNKHYLQIIDEIDFLS